MSPTVKRIFLILGFLALVILIGYGLYYMFGKSQPILPPSKTPGTSGTNTLPGSQGRTTSTDATNTNQGGQNNGLPTAGVIPSANNENYYRPELVTKVTSDFATFPSVGTSGGLRYNNASDGKFYKTNADGSVALLSDQTFYNVKNVTWSKTGNKAVIEYPYPDSSKIVYNFDTKKQATLPKHWQDFSFSPDGNQIAAKSIGLSPENRWLLTTNDDGTGTKLLEPLGNNADKVTVDWSPSRQAVAFSNTGDPQGGERQQILLLGMNNENFKSLIVEGLDFQSQWSNTGKKLLYSVDSARSDFKPELWVVNSFGDNIGSGRQSFQINTWAEKCTFADDTTVYCAIPRDLPQGAGLSPEIARNSSDDLYKIDLRTGFKTPIALDRSYTFDQISYDQTNNKIFFTDANQTGAFQVNL